MRGWAHLALHAGSGKESLAAGSSTAVQDALPWLGVQHSHHQARSLVLHLDGSQQTQLTADDRLQ